VPDGLRADAVRNRAAILRATEELLARHPAEQVTMERVAAAAGVGKGTVFHRFGSRQGLMVALMQERAHDLSVAVTTGPPPLGEGAPDRERLLAFLAAIVDLVVRNKGLLAALGPGAPTPESGPREAHPVYLSWHGHLTRLVAAQRPDVDADMLAHVFLAALHHRPALAGGDRLRHTLHALAEALLPRGVGVVDHARCAECSGPFGSCSCAGQQ
jgi:AcrR family transcriptional regulator